MDQAKSRLRRAARPGVLCAALLAWPAVVSAGAGSLPAGSSTVYAAETAAWRTERAQKLAREDGWLTLVGLYWLQPGENRFGSGGGVPIRLEAPGIPADAGTLVLAGDSVSVRSRAGAALTVNGRRVTDRVLKTDADPDPDVLRLGRLTLQVIRRGDRFGVRVKDSEAATRTRFRGLDWFPLDPALRVEATFVPFDKPREIEIPTAIGTTDRVHVPGMLKFALGGRTLTLLPFAESAGDPLFVVFSDRTSGEETYGAGRFLDAGVPRNGTVILDFNRAYNPPCAFTAFATCPLPPRENRLPVPIHAGEKKYQGPGAHQSD